MLTSRENQVWSFLAMGHANKEIAKLMEIEEATVKVHVKTISMKLKVKNRTQAAIKFYQAYPQFLKEVIFE